MESLAFQSSGETRRRISWDFTVTKELAIPVSAERIAVPLTTLYKRSIKRLDVHGPSQESLVVWETKRNGALAADLLIAGLATLSDVPVSARARELVTSIVFARGASDVTDEINELLATPPFTDQSTPESKDVAAAVAALVRSLAQGFLLVIEVPASWVGVRTVVKVSYDDDRVTESVNVLDPWVGRASLNIDAQGSSGAHSWHLELHAPDDLTISRLRKATWDTADEKALEPKEVAGSHSTAHINGSFEYLWWHSQAQVRLAPTAAGLVNQVTLGVLFALTLLLTASFAAGPLTERLSTDGGSGTIAGLVFSFPALFLALLSRGSEHQLVSRVLMAPRLASFASALLLGAAGVLVAWNPAEETLRDGLGMLASAQSVILLWLGIIRPVGDRS